jgi:hypothetical protein
MRIAVIPRFLCVLSGVRLPLVGAASFFGAMCVEAWASAEEAGPRVLVVSVDPGSTGLDPEAVRKAIAGELRVDVVDAPVANAAGTMSVKVAGTTGLTMTFESTDGWIDVTRQVELPSDPREQIETIALLAGNLARNEAGELLAGLKPKEKPPQARPRPASKRTLPPNQVARADVLPPPKPPERDPCALGREAGGSLRPVGLSLWHPIAVDPHSERHRYHAELGLGYGRIGGLAGGAIDALALRIDGPMVGAAAAGIYLDARGPGCGAYFSGIGVIGRDTLKGGEAAGVFAWRDAEVTGAQGAGVMGYLRGLRGAQAAGVLALDRGRLVGAQVSGIVSVTTGRVEGAQLAGVYNSGGDVDGVQIGLVNQAGHVRGLQVGLVNVSRKVDGIALGLVNVVSEGRTELVAWVDGAERANVGARYLFNPAYLLVGAGYDLEPSTSASSAIGLHLPFGRFFWDLDAMYSFVGDWWLKGVQTFHARHEFRYRAMLGVELVPRWFGVFAGGAAEHGVDSTGRALAWRPEGVFGVQVF